MNPQSADRPGGTTGWWLEWEHGGTRARLPLDRPLRIGREPGCDILLAEATASRRHAVVSLAGGVPHVDASMSRNGLILGGVRIKGADLSSGQPFEIAGTTFRAYQAPLGAGRAAGSAPRVPGASASQSTPRKSVAPVLAIGVLALALVLGLVGFMALSQSGPSASPSPSPTSAPSGEPSTPLPSGGSAPSSVPPAPSPGQSTAAIAARVIPSVVYIECQAGQEGWLGSGVVYNADGYIVTNAHVVEGASKCLVIGSDGQELVPTVVGSDHAQDIAVIKVTAGKLTPAVFGDSSALQVGEDVLVIGSARGLQSTVTKGIVSALDRQINVEGLVLSGLIQTDAPINGGNSGGAMVDMQGRIIGIPTASADKSKAEGIGFAIPSNRARQIADQLIAASH